MGNKPAAFDLLYWNSDGTRMTRAAHSWYLRNTYVENNLIQPGKIRLKGGSQSRQHRPGHLCGRGGEGSHRALGCRLAHHATVRRGGAVRARFERPYRRNHQSSGKGTYWTEEAGTAAASSLEQWLQSATSRRQLVA